MYFVSLKKPRIADNEVTFGKEWCRLDIIKYLFLYTIINKWTILSSF